MDKYTKTELGDGATVRIPFKGIVAIQDEQKPSQTVPLTYAEMDALVEWWTQVKAEEGTDGPGL